MDGGCQESWTAAWSGADSWTVGRGGRAAEPLPPPPPSCSADSPSLPSPL